MSDWHMALLEVGSGDAITDLVEATGRRITFKLNEPTEVGFTVPGRSESAASIRELTTDVMVAWDVFPFARCRVGATTDTLDEDDHSLDVAAVDYVGLLDRRYNTSGGVQTGDLTWLAWFVINQTQSVYPWPGGDLGIRRGLQATTASVTYSYPDGKKCRELIDDVHLQYPGFDYEIDAALMFNCWGFRGTERSFALEYGGNVSRVERSVDPEQYANMIRHSGADGVAPTRLWAPDLATRPEGRIESQEGNTDLPDAAAVRRAAEAYLQRHGTVTPSYRCHLNPAAGWTPDQLWLGDYAYLVVRSGRLDVVTMERVVEIALELGDDGQVDVDITFGDFQESLLQLVRAVPARLEQINRR